MYKNGGIVLKPGKIGQYLVYVLLFYVLIFKFLTTVIGLPSFISYLTDVMVILLFFISTRRFIWQFKKNSFFRVYYYWIISFLIFTFICLIFKQQLIILYIWSIRNNFRFYIFLISCISLLNIKNIDTIFKLLFSFLYANVLLCSFQYFVLNLKGDLLGGFFGVTKGSNGYMNLLLLIITCFIIASYLLGKTKLIKCSTILIMCGYIAVLTELKMYIFELIFVITLTVLITKFTLKKLVIIIVGGIILTVSINYIYQIYDGNGFFSLDEIMKYSAGSKGYSSVGDLNRFTALQSISSMFLTEPIKLWTGLGLGSCEYGKYDFLISDFYNKYSYLNYTWFSHAFIFLETGLVGLFFFLGFFVVAFWQGKKLKKECDEINVKLYCVTIQVFAIGCILLSVYNISLRMESGYLAYFILAIPGIIRKSVIYKQS